MDIIKLQRPVRSFPSELDKYAFNFAYQQNMYNYSSPFLADVIKYKDLVTPLSEFLKSIPGQDNNFNFPLRKNIICKDILNPHTIPNLELSLDEQSSLWGLPKTVPIALYTVHNMDYPAEQILNSGKYTLIQNDAFLLAVRNLTDSVELYLYKK